MRQKSATRWALVLIGILTLAAALFGVLVRLNSEYGFVACTATTRFGWIVPVVGGAVLGLVVLLLLGEGEHTPEDSRELRASVCRVCGNEVINEWRLCPHCGQMLHGPSHEPVGSSTAPVSR